MKCRELLKRSVWNIYTFIAYTATIWRFEIISDTKRLYALSSSLSSTSFTSQQFSWFLEQYGS